MSRVEMSLVVARMFDDVKLPEKAHAFDSGFDVFNYSFKKLFVRDDKLYEKASQYIVAAGDVDPTLSCLSLTNVTEVWLDPLDRVMIGTGIKATVDYKNTSMSEFCNRHDLTWEIQVRPRSGTTLKRGLTITNSPGTLDKNYTGEISLIVTNLSNNIQKVELGERLAQLVPCLVALPSLKENNILEVDSRGSKGFNSTGTN